MSINRSNLAIIPLAAGGLDLVITGSDLCDICKEFFPVVNFHQSIIPVRR